MAKSSGTTRASSSGSPRGLTAGQYPDIRDLDLRGRALKEYLSTLTDGYYSTDGINAFFLISDNTINSYKAMSKAELRDEAIRLNRGIYADEPGRSKSDYIGDILTARFGSRAKTLQELSTEEKRRLYKIPTRRR